MAPQDGLVQRFQQLNIEPVGGFRSVQAQPSDAVGTHIHCHGCGVDGGHQDAPTWLNSSTPCVVIWVTTAQISCSRPWETDRWRVSRTSLLIVMTAARSRAANCAAK